MDWVLLVDLEFDRDSSGFFKGDQTNTLDSLALSLSLNPRLVF